MSDAGLRLVVLGLSLTSSWGNGHATTYRALLKAFAARGHEVLFLERDVPWYAANRDLADPQFCRLELYRDIAELQRLEHEIARADAVILGSYVPEGVVVGDFVQRVARGVTAFYDIDTPVTLAKLERGDEEYLAAEQIANYDLYLSFTGGPILDRLMRDFGAPMARVLYCSVDDSVYRPLGLPHRWDLSYLGTYSSDRQPKLERLLLEPARRAPHLRFAVGGPQYPDGIAWPGNVERMDHVPPGEHPQFYAMSRFTLNVTRDDMVRAGYSPSVRLFEAGACGTPVVSDEWDGIESLFTPGEDIVLAADSGDVLGTLLGCSDNRRQSLASALQHRVRTSHTAAHRAAELEAHLRKASRQSRRRTPSDSWQRKSRAGEKATS